MNPLNYALGTLSIFTIIFGGMYAIAYLSPFLNIANRFEKRHWLNKVFKDIDAGMDKGEIEAELHAANNATDKLSVFNIFSYVLAVGGIFLAIFGLLMIVIPESKLDGDLMKLFIFLPLVTGVGVYFAYLQMFKEVKFWKEFAVSVLYIGFAITFIGFWPTYELDFMRMDFVFFITLAAGLYGIYYFKTTVISYVYLIILLIGIGFSSMIFMNADSWLNFTSSFYWIFAIAILYFWIPQLKNTKYVSTKEIVFGILFAFTMVTLCINPSITNGVGVLFLSMVLPGLYLFSKAYYKSATWFHNRPVQSMVVLATLLLAVAFSFESVIEATHYRIAIFENFSFAKVVSYIFLIGLAGGVFYLYSNEIEGKVKDVNMLVLAYPLLAFLLSWIGAGWLGYIGFIIGLAFALNYVRMALEDKNEIVLVYGLSAAVFIVVAKLLEIFQEFITEKLFIGFMLLIFGAGFLALIYFIRDKWGADHPEKLEDHPSNPDIIDV